MRDSQPWLTLNTLGDCGASCATTCEVTRAQLRTRTDAWRVTRDAETGSNNAQLHLTATDVTVSLLLTAFHLD